MPIESRDLRIELFDPRRHDRSAFDCGVARLDNFLKLTAKKQHAADMTRVYVAVEDGQSIVLGYHAINLGRMDVRELVERPRGAPEHGDLPVLFLGQVAVTREAQGAGIGAVLMHHVFEKACRVSEQAGCFAVVLDVMADGGEAQFARRRDWYAAFGFRPFATNPSRMFVTMKYVRALVAERIHPGGS